MKIAGTLSIYLLVCACSGEISGGTGSPDADPSAPDADPSAPDAAPGAPDAAPAPPDADPGAAGLTPELQELFEIINSERAARGLTAVALRDDLVCAAQRHSDDIGVTMSCTHTGSDGSSPGDRVAGCGGSGWSGEIVACGHGTPRAAVDGWISSPGHNAIMFTPEQRTIGVGMLNNFWTAIFDQ